LLRDELPRDALASEGVTLQRPVSANSNQRS
jgi:hypothetical protein